MCGTSTSCGKLCLWLTPVSMCLMLAAIGFSMFGTCLYGWYFSRKVEDDFTPWTCKVSEVWELRGQTAEMVAFNAYPVNFSEEDYFEIRNDRYLRREEFMTKIENYNYQYNSNNSFYICNLYGYNDTTFTVEERHTIVWDYEKMQKFFNTMVVCGFGLGLFGLFSFLCFWAMDKRGVIMHAKVKQIFFWLIFATASFVTGLCGLMICLYPYNNVAKVCGLTSLAISLFYPFFCIWATCIVVREVRQPTDEDQNDEVHHVPGDPGYTIAVKSGDESQTTETRGELEGIRF